MALEMRVMEFDSPPFLILVLKEKVKKNGVAIFSSAISLERYGTLPHNSYKPTLDL